MMLQGRSNHLASGGRPTGSVPNGNSATPKRVDRPQGSLFDVCLTLRDRVDSLLAAEPDTPLVRDVQAQLRLSIDIVEQALDRYRLEQISISYNGGKDCLVVLIVLLACLGRHFGGSESTLGASAGPSFPNELQAVYTVYEHSFPEIDAFVASSGAEYHLDIARFELSMRKGLELFLAENPSIEAIFVGTRRTDPHGQDLKHFDPTDAGWPKVMRIHPVIDWHYAEIWTFIRYLGIPYCPLYDQGYTSLGSKDDTHPNPRLKKDEGNVEEFRPAYELMEDEEERLGRD